MLGRGKRARTSVDDLLAVQVGQPVEDAFGDLPEHLFPDPTAKFLDFTVDTVQAAAFAVLHCDRDHAGGGVAERTVIPADVLRGNFAVEVELATDLLLHVWVGVRGDDLKEAC